MNLYFPSYELHNLFPTELSNKEVAHSGVEIEEKALGLVVKIISFPKVDGVDLGVVYRLQRYLLSVSVRMQYRIGRFWRTEFVFFGNPVAKIHNSKTGGRRTVVLTHDLGNSETAPPEFVDVLIREWNQVNQRVAFRDYLLNLIFSLLLLVTKISFAEKATFNQYFLHTLRWFTSSCWWTRWKTT